MWDDSPRFAKAFKRESERAKPDTEGRVPCWALGLHSLFQDHKGRVWRSLSGWSYCGSSPDVILKFSPVEDETMEIGERYYPPIDVPEQRVLPISEERFSEIQKGTQ